MPLLHSKIIGQGKPLIILHGYFGSGDNWKSLATHFSENFEVHLVDQRNHGRSFHTAEFNYQLMVEDLYRYMNYHQLKNAHILGHSMGGKTAMLFAIEHVDFVNKLIVADISPKSYKPHHNEIIAGLNAVDFSVQNTRNLVDEKLAEYIPELGVRQFLLKNVYWKEKGQLGYRFNLESLTANNKEVGNALPLSAVFKGVTLFLKGANSGYISSEDQPIIHNHFPNAQLVVIANAEHWLHAENPADFFKAVTEFLG